MYHKKSNKVELSSSNCCCCFECVRFMYNVHLQSGTLYILLCSCVYCRKRSSVKANPKLFFITNLLLLYHLLPMQQMNANEQVICPSTRVCLIVLAVQHVLCQVPSILETNKQAVLKPMHS